MRILITGVHGFVGSNLNSKEFFRNILWNDSDINVDWSALGLELDGSMLSERDAKAPLLKDSDCNFYF